MSDSSNIGANVGTTEDLCTRCENHDGLNINDISATVDPAVANVDKSKSTQNNKPPTTVNKNVEEKKTPIPEQTDSAVSTFTVTQDNLQERVHLLETQLQRMNLLETQLHQMDNKLQNTLDAAATPPEQHPGDTVPLLDDKNGTNVDEEEGEANNNNSSGSRSNINGEPNAYQLVKETGKSMFQTKIEKHQKGVINQIVTMQLESKFDIRTAYTIAVIVLLVKLFFIVIFTVRETKDCTPTTAVVDADQDDKLLKSMFSTKEDQHVCSSYSLNSHYYSESSEEWLQNTQADMFGVEDPREYLDLSQEGYTYYWTGLDALVSTFGIGTGNNNGDLQAIKNNTASSSITNTTSTIPQGWEVFTDSYYVHNCAEKCSLRGHSLGFWAVDYKTNTIDCWCGKHTTDTTCLVDYATAFDDSTTTFTNLSYLSKNQYKEYTEGFNKIEMEKFTNFFEEESKRTPLTGCRYDYKRDAKATPQIHKLAWGNRLFFARRVIVFSKEPLLTFKTCNQAELNNLCQVNASLQSMAKKIAARASTIANSSAEQWAKDQAFEGVTWRDAREAYGKTLDQKTGKEHWHPCSLTGFTCTNYSHSQCDKFREPDKPFCGNTSYRDDFFVVDPTTCFGVTSVTWITCPKTTLVLGSAFGYLGLLELGCVAFLAFVVLWYKNDRAGAIAVATGAMKVGAQELASIEMKKAMKDVDTKIDTKIGKFNKAIEEWKEDFEDGMIDMISSGRALGEATAEEKKQWKKDAAVWVKKGDANIGKQMKITTPGIEEQIKNKMVKVGKEKKEPIDIQV